MIRHRNPPGEFWKSRPIRIIDEPVKRRVPWLGLALAVVFVAAIIGAVLGVATLPGVPGVDDGVRDDSPRSESP